MLGAESSGKVLINPVDPASLASTLQSDSLEEAKDRIQHLENELFAAQKTIAALKEEVKLSKQATEDSSASPTKKKAKLDELASDDINDSSPNSDNKAANDQLLVMKAELEAVKQVADKRLIELDDIFKENQHLKLELDHQKEQVSACCFVCSVVSLLYAN